MYVGPAEQQQTGFRKAVLEDSATTVWWAEAYHEICLRADVNNVSAIQHPLLAIFRLEAGQLAIVVG